MSPSARAILIGHVAATIAAVAVVAHGTDWDRPWTPPAASRSYPFDPRSRFDPRLLFIPRPPSIRPPCAAPGPFPHAPKTARGLESALYRAAFEVETKDTPEPVIVARTALPFDEFAENRSVSDLPAALQAAIARGSSDCSAINLSELPPAVEFRDVFGFADCARLAPHQVGLTFSVPLVSDRDAVVVDLYCRVGYARGSYLWFQRNADGTDWTLVRSII